MGKLITVTMILVVLSLGFQVADAMSIDTTTNLVKILVIK